jgi:acylphosphatase
MNEPREPVRSPVGPDRPRARVGVTVRGVVQGVGFRWFVHRSATDLGISGWVANRSDGSVEVLAEGPEPAIDALLDALRTGPDGAWVSDLSIRREPATGLSGGFSIRSGGHAGD